MVFLALKYNFTLQNFIEFLILLIDIIIHEITEYQTFHQ